MPRSARPDAPAARPGAALLALLFILAACGDDGFEAPDGGTLDDEAAVGAPRDEATDPASADAPQADLLAVAEADGRFGLLLAAIEQAGLSDDLTGGDYTLFAPTDDAFAALGDDAQDALLDPANRGALRTLLRYHLVSGARLSGDLGDAPLRTLTGRPLAVEAGAGRLTVGEGGAVVTEPDRRAANGVIHVIDAVLLPPDDLL